MKMATAKKNRNLTKDERFKLGCVLAGIVLILGCASGLMFERLSWRFSAGLLEVVAADIITYKLYGKRLWAKRPDGTWCNENGKCIATSNLLALVVSAGLSPFYLANNEAAAEEVSRLLNGMSFSSGNVITNLSGIVQNIPIINAGLCVLMVCWVVFAVVKKLF